MHRIHRPLAVVLTLLLVAMAVRPAAAQQKTRPPISTATLRRDLFLIAADSMEGRDTGTHGNWLAAEYVASEYRRLGLQPAGDSGTFFQVIPFVHVYPDTSAHIVAGSNTLVPGRDLVPFSSTADWSMDGMVPVYGGVAGDSTTWPDSAAIAGHLVVLAVPAVDARSAMGAVRATLGAPVWRGAAGFAIVAMDMFPADITDQSMQGSYTTDTASTSARHMMMLSDRGAVALLGAKPASLSPGATGPALRGGIMFRRDPLPWAARNVIGVLPGSDPKLAGTYVSISAHNDHVGYTRAPISHDSVWAHNHVIRPMGADTPDRDPTPEEAARIRTVQDSLGAIRPDRPDSIFNGADDDGTGTVALLEIARSLAAGPRPKRSVLFISHAAEERGLLGSKWFTDHPTVARDSLVGEIDMDMIGRGGVHDLPEGGPGYLEVVGSRRVSREYGDLLETVNARQAAPFKFNYAYDAPGHPLQYYCRADHYGYARYGIPAFAVSRGEHADYHQVTDEAEYIDYNALARVATLVRDFAAAVANLDHAPHVDTRPVDPHAPCRQ